MIDCKLHRLLLHSVVFGSVRSYVFAMGKRKFEIDQFVQSIRYKVKTNVKLIHGLSYFKTERWQK